MCFFYLLLFFTLFTVYKLTGSELEEYRLKVSSCSTGLILACEVPGTYKFNWLELQAAEQALDFIVWYLHWSTAEELRL
jgi:hypothetical protein